MEPTAISHGHGHDALSIGCNTSGGIQGIQGLTTDMFATYRSITYGDNEIVVKRCDGS